jgi:hypothetical protein
MEDPTAHRGPADAVMDPLDRRRADRKAEVFPVTLVLGQPVQIEGHTVNLSREGVFLQAQGRIPLLVEIKGKQYRAQLVRALPMDDTTAYAIELLEVIE